MGRCSLTVPEGHTWDRAPDGQIPPHYGHVSRGAGPTPSVAVLYHPMDHIPRLPRNLAVAEHYFGGVLLLLSSVWLYPRHYPVWEKVQCEVCHHTSSSAEPPLCLATGGSRAALTEEKKKRSVPIPSFPKNAHGRLEIGDWRLAADGGWWRLMVVGGIWWLGIGG